MSWYDDHCVKLFWRHIRKTRSCWLWTGYIRKTGYAHFTLCDGRTRNVHRIALELRLGRTLRPGMQANHKCPNHNRHCVRHVYEGTHLQNMADRLADGNQVDQVGEKNHAAKLTEDQVVEILKMRPFKRYGLQTELARKYNVDRCTIKEIWSGRNWPHVQV